MTTPTPTINPTSHPAPFNLMEWITVHRSELKPPVGNKMIHSAGTQYKVMVVGGPNIRTDYHINEGEEFFWQLEGDMVLKVVDDGQFKDVIIRECDCFLLPGNIPHSPQRLSGSVGLVIERERDQPELDGLRWYCRSCWQVCHCEFFRCEDLGTQLKTKINDYYNDEEQRTCKHCGTVDQVPEFDRSAVRTVEDIIAVTRSPQNMLSDKLVIDHDSFSSMIVPSGTRTAAAPHTKFNPATHPPPFSLKQFIARHEHELQPPVSNKMLYGGPDCESQIQIVGGPNHRTDFHIEDGEEWFYQIKGSMILRVVDGGQQRDIEIKEGEQFLLPPFIPHSPQRFANTVGLVVERRRKSDWQKDGLRWYCSGCHDVVYETRFDCVDLGTQLKAVINDYYADPAKRTCQKCGKVDEKHEQRG